MHRGLSNLPTPPPDNITEEVRSKPDSTRFDSGMDIDFQGGSLHSPVSSGQPPVSQEVSKTTIQPVAKEEDTKDTEWRKPSVDDFDFLTTLG